MLGWKHGQKEENGDGNEEAAATRMQANAAIGAGSEQLEPAAAGHRGQRQRREELRAKY
jgi:hypothetical protein